MRVDDSVIAALEAAVTASPESRAVRLHLGGLLTPPRPERRPLEFTVLPQLRPSVRKIAHDPSLEG